MFSDTGGNNKLKNESIEYIGIIQIMPIIFDCTENCVILLWCCFMSHALKQTAKRLKNPADVRRISLAFIEVAD